MRLAALYAAGLLLAFGLAEGYLRVARPRISPESLRNQSLEYECVAFARHALARIEKPAFPICRRGHRGVARDMPKPAGVLRLVVMGGSGAFDPNAAPGQDWPSRLERLLHERGHTEVEVINAAVPGHATPDALGLLATESWAYEPDYVLLYESWNDIKYFARLDEDYSLLRTIEPGVPCSGDHLVANPFIYYANPIDQALCHSQVYVRVRSRFLNWRMHRYGEEGALPTNERRGQEVGRRQYEFSLRLFVDAVHNAGATAILLTQARLPTRESTKEDRARIHYEWVGLSHDELVDAFDFCDRTMLRVAREKNAKALDVARDINGDAAAFADHVHLTSHGSERLSQAVASAMETALRAE